MFEVKTSDLTGATLDWAVAKCEGLPIADDTKRFASTFSRPFYSTDWAQGGPIIEREFIELAARSDQWGAAMHFENGSIYAEGQTPLIAAMRCYVASKLGDTVKIPTELIKD